MDGVGAIDAGIAGAAAARAAMDRAAANVARAALPMAPSDGAPAGGGDAAPAAPVSLPAPVVDVADQMAVMMVASAAHTANLAVIDTALGAYQSVVEMLSRG